VAFEADVRLNTNQHFRSAMVAGMAVEAGDLFRLPFERHVGEERMSAVRINGSPAEELLAEMALSTEHVLFALGHPGSARRKRPWLGDMRHEAFVAGAALAKFGKRDPFHSLFIAVTALLPRCYLRLVTGHADRSGRSHFRRPVGFDGRGGPRTGACCNRKGDADHYECPDYDFLSSRLFCV